jgi:hypothetical protein
MTLAFEHKPCQVVEGVPSQQYCSQNLQGECLWEGKRALIKIWQPRFSRKRVVNPHWIESHSSRTLCFQKLPQVRDHVSQPYNTTAKIIVFIF